MPLRHILFVLFLLASAVLLLSCQAATKPSEPTIDPQAKIEERTKVFDNYKLEFTGHVFWGFGFTQGSSPESYLPPQVKDLFMSSSPAAADAFNNAIMMNTVGKVFSIIGGFGIVYPVYSAISTGQTPLAAWLVFAGSAASIGASIIFSILATDGYILSVKEYNAALRKKLNLNDPKTTTSFLIMPEARYSVLTGDLSAGIRIFEFSF